MGLHYRPNGGLRVRTNNRAIGAGSAVVIAMVMCAVPATARAANGGEAKTAGSSGQIGTAYSWTGAGNPDAPTGWSSAGWEYYQDAPGNWPNQWAGTWPGDGPAPTATSITPVSTATTDPAAPVAPVGTEPPVAAPTTTMSDPIVTSTATGTAPATDPAAPVPTGTATPLPSSSVPVTGTGRAVPNRSGLPWASGVFVPSYNPGDVESFAAWRGRPVDVVVTWSARQTWDDIINPAALYAAYKGTPYTMAFGVAPVPEADGSATMAGCASGAYNDKWTQFGTNIVAAGMGKSIIRLGWEFNGNWYKWQASDPNQFAECYRQIVSTVRKVAPDLFWDWTVNRGAGQSVADARLAYPGDEYVDFVGLDSYDAWPGATGDANWEQQYAGQYGLKFWADFAKEHGKKFSVPEWGLFNGTSAVGNSGGDNAFYIQKMEEFFKAEGSDLAYESYFNDHAEYYGGGIFAPIQNPNGSARYHASLVAP